MRYPEFIKKNGTIGFLAPSFGCATEPYTSAFNNALKNFKEMGYQCKLGPNCYVMEGVGISNTPEKCGQEVMDMFLDEESDSLISCGGGELMCEILEFVDFEKLKETKPKWFMGFSDNTNLVHLLPTLCDTAAIYAPCASAYGMDPWHESIFDAFNVFTGKQTKVSGYDLWEREYSKDEEHPLLPYNVTRDRILRLYKDGVFVEDARESDMEITMKGRLIGGCMDCLVNLLGTRFDKTVEYVEKYKEDGILWFLEACDLNVFSIRRAMWQMEQAGWFKYVKGFIFGRALNGEPMMDLDSYKAVLHVAAKYNVPVVMDADIGHLSPMMPIVSGSIGEIRVKGNDITLEMEYR